MALWLRLMANADPVGVVEIQRREVLDLADPATADAVSTYDVRRDREQVGTVTHRYGDGAWVLLAKAAALVAAVKP